MDKTNKSLEKKVSSTIVYFILCASLFTVSKVFEIDFNSLASLTTLAISCSVLYMMDKKKSVRRSTSDGGHVSIPVNRVSEDHYVLPMGEVKRLAPENQWIAVPCIQGCENLGPFPSKEEAWNALVQATIE